MVLGRRVRRISTRIAAASLVAAGALFAVGAPASAAPSSEPVAPSRTRPSGTRGAPPLGVLPRAGGVVTPPPRADRPKLTLRRADTTEIMQTESAQTYITCWPWANYVGGGVGYDDYLEEMADIGYAGGVDCDGPLDYITGSVGLVDRSPAFNGQVFNGTWLISSNMRAVYSTGTSTAAGARVFARSYNGARTAEPVIELILQAPSTTIWDSCGYVPGLYYYTCSGLGTSSLYLLMGAGYWGTGLTQACRDQAERGDAEQQRLTRLNGSTPASTQILNLIPAVRDRVIAFKRGLCSTGPAGASAYAASQGQQLWDTAVAEAKRTDAQAAGRLYDDRPLYWARLSMTLALQQWKPPSTVDRSALQRTLDRSSRGMDSHSFAQGTSKRVFVTGFDPFGLDNGIMSGNPSAAAVLGLDGTLMDGAEIQVVIFPVRYADFNAFIVEDAVTPHLQAGPQQATLITTVSQGRPDTFDLEYWNGRNRTVNDFPDNLYMKASGSPSYPEEPPYQAQGKQFARSTLPMKDMRVGTSFPVCTHVVLKELMTPGETPYTEPPQTSLECSLDAVPTPTSGWLAVEGGGGGFLSNEVAYRVTELRDRLGVTVPSGHIHTPWMSTSPTSAERTPIVLQYRQILAAAIAATPGSGNYGSLYCGEASCTPVTDAYISHFTGADCTGTESYYTLYYNSDGVRRSWDGRGLAGTTLRTVTNRSWRGTDGQCHNDWQDGNTLSGFVTIYRCGEPTCTPVTDAYISHFTGANCTGTESYYTLYYNSDGVRRSWDGRGVAGTTLRTVTNRSWRGTDGQCHNDWQDGNTLSGFVTIYR